MNKRIISIILAFTMIISIYSSIRPYERLAVHASGSESFEGPADGGGGGDDGGSSGGDEGGSGSGDGGNSGGSGDVSVGDGESGKTGEGGGDGGGEIGEGGGGGDDGGSGGGDDFDEDEEPEAISPLDIVLMLDELIPGQPEIDLEQVEYGIKFDSALSIDIKSVSSDPLGLGLSYSIEKHPSTGTAEIANSGDKEGILIYTPDPDSTAKTETITVRVSNGTEHTDVTITVHIFEPPNVPASGSASYTLDEDEDVQVNLNSLCTDPRGHDLAYSVKTGAQNGDVSILGGTLTYTPELNFFGSDSAVIEVSHKKIGDISSPYGPVEFTVGFTVNSVEDAPEANDDGDDGSITVKSNGSVIIDVLGNDKAIEDAGLEIAAITSAPSKAQSCYITSENKIFYKPNPRESGPDTFEYSVKHAGGEYKETATATVTVIIEKENDKQEIELEEGAITIDEDTPLEFKFTVIDIDGNFDDFDIDITSDNSGVFDEADILPIAFTDDPENPDEREYTVKWQPVENAYTASGPVSIEITVTDDNGGSPLEASTTLLVTVRPVNDEPEIKITGITNIGSADDAKNDALDFSSGVVEIDEDEALELVFEVYDIDTADMSVNSFDISFSSSDTDVLPAGGIMRVSDITKTKVIDENTVQYTYRLHPALDKYNENGFEITITAQDEDAYYSDDKDDTKAFILIVMPVNDPPIANDDEFTEEEKDAPLEDEPTILDVLANDIDVDGHETIRIIAAGKGSEDGVDVSGVSEAGGTVEIIADASGTPGRLIRYTSAPDYGGADGFYYTISDGEYEDTAYVEIWVEAVNDPPEILPVYSTGNNWVEEKGYFLGKEDTELRIRIGVNDVETANSALQLQSAVPAGNDPESVTLRTYVEPLSADERYVVFVPRPDRHNTDEVVTLKLTLSDGFVKSELDIDVFIEAVNDAPVAVPKEFRFDEHKPGYDPVFISITELMKGDYDVDVINSKAAPPVFDYDFDMNATLAPLPQKDAGAHITTGNKNGVPGIFFHPVENSEVTVTFKYQIKDDGDPPLTAQATVTLRPIPINDAPYVDEITGPDFDPDTMTLNIVEDSSDNPISITYGDYETPDNKNLKVSIGSLDSTIISPAGLKFEGSQGDGKTGTLYITPLPDKYTVDEPVIVTVTISDGERATLIRINVNVEAMPDSPTATDNEYDAIADRESIFTPLDDDFDVDGEEITLIHVEDVTGPTLIEEGGEAAVISYSADGTIRFKAPKGFEGTYTLEYTIQDTSDYIYNTATATITINVTAFGTDPVIGSMSGILASVNIPENRTITLHNVPNAYTLEVASRNQSILPDSAIKISGKSSPAGFSGGPGEQTQTLTITAPDNITVGSTFIDIKLTHGGKTDEITVPVTVKRTNDAPVANNDHYNDASHPLYDADPLKNPLIINEGESSGNLDVLLNDTDDQSTDNLIIQSVTQPSRGRVEIVGGRQLRYYPPDTRYSRSYFHGDVSFTYTIMDAGGKTGSATVTLKVLPVATPPYVNSEYITNFSLPSATDDQHILIYDEGTPVKKTTFTQGVANTIPGTRILSNDGDNDDFQAGKTLEMDTVRLKVISFVLDDDDPETPANIAYSVDLVTNDFTFTPQYEGWYLINYYIETDNKYDPLTTGYKASNENPGTSYSTAWAYIAVSFGDPLPPRISGREITSNEDNWPGPNLPPVINPDATYAEGPYDRVIEITGNIQPSYTNNPVKLNLHEPLTSFEENSNSVLEGWEIYMEETDPGMANRFFLRYRQKPDQSGTTRISWQVCQGDHSSGTCSAPATASKEGSISVVVYAVNDPPEIEFINPPPVIAQNEWITVDVKISDIDSTILPSRTRVTSTYYNEETEEYEFADLYIPGEMMTLVKLDAKDAEFEDHWRLTLRAIDYDIDDHDKVFRITVFVNDGSLSVDKSFDVTIDPQNNAPEVYYTHSEPFLDVIEEDTQGEYNAAFLGIDKDGNAISIVFEPQAENDENAGTGIFFYSAADGKYYENTGGKYGGVYLTARDMKLNYYPANDFYTQAWDWDDADWDSPGGDFIEIRYRLTDESLISDIGYIRIQITPENDAPEILGLRDNYPMLEDKPELIIFRVRDIDTYDFDAPGKATINMTLEDSDYDPDNPPANKISNYIESIVPKSIEAIGNNEYEVTLELKFIADMHHDDLNPLSRTNVTITILDGDGGVTQAVFSVKITSVNDPVFPIMPLTIPNSDVPYLKATGMEGDKVVYFMEIDEDQTVFFDIVKLFDDVDGSRSEIFLASLSDVEQGAAANYSNQVRFVPTRDLFHDEALMGDYSEDAKAQLAKFDFTVMDLHGAEYESTAYIFINAVNDDPVAPNFSETTYEDEPVLLYPILEDESRVWDVDNELDELEITGATVLNGKGKVEIIPKFMDLDVEYTDENGAIKITKFEYSSSDYPYQRLYYIPGIDENSPDHAGGGAFRIEYTVSDNNTEVKPYTAGTGTGIISVTVNSVHDAPRLNLEVDTIWEMYEDNEYRYYFKNGLPDHTDPIDPDEDRQSPFGLRMWTPELYKDLSLKITSYEYNPGFWETWSSGGDVSGIGLAAHRNVVRGENIRLDNEGKFGDPDIGWYEVHIIPELNQYGMLILQIKLDDGTEETVAYVKVIVMPVNDVPELIVIGETAAGENRYEFTISERQTLNKNITGRDVETPAPELKFRVPTADDADAWNSPSGTLADLLPANGSVEVKQNGSNWYFEYKPKDYYYGTDSFYLVAEDKALTIDGKTLAAEKGFTRIDVTINNVNDPPSIPEVLRTDSDSYKDGEPVTVFFKPSTDDYENRQETLDEDILYIIEVSYNGINGPWTTVLDGKTISQAGIATHIPGEELSYTFTHPRTGEDPAVNTGSFVVRVYARDTEVAGAAAKESGKSDSGFIKIDNTAPVFDHKLVPDSYTNTPVDIVLDVKDNGAGNTGVDKVIFVNKSGEPSANEPLTGTGSEYRHRAVVNGTYYFKAIDNIGNETALYKVDVDIIDKINPVVEADIGEILYSAGKYAYSGAKVVLTYSDKDDPTGDFCNSGVAARQYIINGDDKDNAPGENANWGTSYTTDNVTVPLDVKGKWYLHAKVTDNAGNFFIDTFGPYEINNTEPKALDGDAEVWEHTADIGGETKLHYFTIDLKKYVDDPDNDTFVGDPANPHYGDMKEFTVNKLGAEGAGQIYGTWAETSERGVYTFTHSGHGNPFVNALYVEFTVTDYDDAESNTGRIDITVHEVNDAPGFGGGTVISTENITHSSTTGDDVTKDDIVRLTWPAAADEEETDSDDLYYEIEICYNAWESENNRVWVSVHTTDPGDSLTFDFDVPDDRHGVVLFRIHAWDNGLKADGDPFDDGQDALESEWIYSKMHNLDNTPPALTSSVSPGGFTNGNVLVTLTVEEPLPGDTGIKEVKALNANTTKAGPLNFVSDSKAADGRVIKQIYTFNATVIGDDGGLYRFGVEDAVGNYKEYSVTVNKIDKLKPSVSASPGEILYSEDKYASSNVEIKLTYSDTAADTENCMSGVNTRQYVFNDSPDAPAFGGAWGTLYTTDTVSVPINTKGEWYIHAKVTDNAGNYFIDTFGPYEINNSSPIATDFAEEVWESTVGAGKTNTLTFDIREHVTDVDNRPAASDNPGYSDYDKFIVTPPAEMADYGDWDIDEDTGVCTFVHNGKGMPFIDTFVLEYYVTDKGDGDSRENFGGKPNTITITVHEVNDVPSAPLAVAASEDSYKDDQTVVLTWTPSTDEETEEENIVYHIEVCYDDEAGDWDYAGTTGPGEAFFNFYLDEDETGGNNGMMQFRVWADDRGYNAEKADGTKGDEDTLEPEISGVTYSPKYNLDNTPPALSYTLEADEDTDTNKDVVITLTVTDNGKGDTGIASVESLYTGDYAGELIEVDTSDDGSHVYTLTVEQNGTYRFEVTDNIGNKRTYNAVVGNIDKLPPPPDNITADPPHRIGAANAVYSQAGETVELEYYDDPGDTLNKESGIGSAWYIMESSGNTPPANDTRWKLYDDTDQVPLNKKGTWYVHVKVIDNAGNVTIKTFGTYLVLNHNPETQDGEVTVYEHNLGGGENSIVIDFLDYSTDPDGKDDIVNFTVDASDVLKHGTWEKLSFSEYRFTHGGNGKAPFTDELKVTFFAIDNDGNTSREGKDEDEILPPAVLTIKVKEVNDPPFAPSGIAPLSGTYKDGNIVSLKWAAASDEETPQEKLKYEIEVNYNGGKWESVAETAAGQTSYDYKIPGGGISGTMQFRIRAVDDGRAADEVTVLDKVSGKWSEWAQSEPLVIDNIPPEAEVEFEVRGAPYKPGDPAMEEVDMLVDFIDDGGAGLLLFGYALNEDPNPPEDENSEPDLPAYTMLSKPADNVITCPGIGDFYLHLYALDNAGNEYFGTANASSEPMNVLNTRPVAIPQKHTITRGGSIVITLDGTDYDPGDCVEAYALDRDVIYGTLTLSPDDEGDEKIYVYTNNNFAYVQNDSFTFTVTDSFGIESFPAVVSINISAPELPELQDASPTPPPGTPLPPVEPLDEPSLEEDSGLRTGTGNSDGDTNEDDIYDGDFDAIADDGLSGGPGGDAGGGQGDGYLQLPTNPISGVSVIKYGEGSLILVVQSAENNSVHQKSLVTLNDPHEAIVSILSKEDLEQVLNGARIEVRVNVEYIRHEAHQEDKALIEGAIIEYRNEISGLTLGEYLDITVEYRFEGKPWNNVTHTDGEIELCVDISKDLRRNNAKAYYILRSHEGEATLLNDIDHDPNTITFRTDRFSIYAKAFTQMVPGKPPCPLCGHCREPLGICSNIWLLALFTIAITMIYTNIRNRRRPELALITD